MRKLQKIITTLLACMCLVVSVFTFSACGIEYNSLNDGLIVQVQRDGTCKISGYTAGIPSDLEIKQEIEVIVSQNPLKKETYTVTGIKSGAFKDCVQLKNIEFGFPIEKIEANTFYGCTSLTEMEIPSTVKSIGWAAFYNCTSLKEVTFNEGLETIEYNAFRNCTALEEVDIPDTVKKIMGYAFGNCEALKCIFVGDSVEFIGGTAFGYGDELEHVYIGEHVNDLGGWALHRSKKLQKIEVHENNKEFQSIDGNLYAKRNTVLVQYAVGASAWKYAVENGTREIENYAFYGSENLLEIYIPDTVEKIGEYAFGKCKNLQRVYYDGTEEEWKEIELSAFGNYDLTCTVHFYSAAKPTGTGKYWHYVEDAPRAW